MKKKLHVMRVRSVGDSQFFDPATDFRAIIPAALKIAAESWPDAERFLYVLRIRLEEDVTPLEKQFSAFASAFAEVPAEARTSFCEKFFLAMIAAYSLYVRRDAPLKETAIQKAFMEAVSILVAQSDAATSMLQSVTPLTTQSKAVDETGAEYQRLRDRAARLINADGANWTEAAALCDQAFESGQHTADEDNIALALAYPTYSENTLTVTVTEDEEEAGDVYPREAQ